MSLSHPETAVIVYDPSRCTGCRYCEMACAVWHCGRLELGQSRLRILFDAAGAAERYSAVNCQHCDDPICCAVCPAEALQKDPRTGWVTQNGSKCIGCEMCILACPLAVPFFDERLHVALKCDFCQGAPECVAHCSTGALRLVSREEAVRTNERLFAGAGDTP